ncbi:MAG: tetratricopeptide repeat protein [Prevotella sp.]|nr:tetratricopeptide repeat protein [Prevotella sp.]
MDLAYLIKHPEQMDKETLYDLRSLLALHPYYQTARILLLQNLYLLHDSSFDEELRRAAIYVTDRKVLFQLVEAAHYQLRKNNSLPNQKEKTVDKTEQSEGGSRTVALIDNFLDSIPADNESGKTKKRKPTPADAAVDYVAYLLDVENEEEAQAEQLQLKGQSLIDDFIYKEGGSFELKEIPEYKPDISEWQNEDEKETDEGYFTETLARIYIKQGRYSKALEIIQRLNLVYPKKNRYFADQIRFLEKLILNNNKK